MATYSPPAIYWADSATDPQPNNNRSFRWQSTSGTKHYYRGYNGSTIDAGPMEIYYDTSDQKWYDSGTDHPNAFIVNTNQSVPTNWSSATDPSSATGTANAEYVHLRRNTGTYLFSFQMAGWSSGSGSGGGNAGSGSGSGPSSVGYPPPRTTRFISAIGIGLSWAWNTYQVYSAASGGSPFGGTSGGGWVADFVAGNLVHEATAEVEVGSGVGPGAGVQPGDELYIAFDDDHDDESSNPNMTITTDVIDEQGNTVNPSNTPGNTVTAGNTGTTTIVKIQCARKPKGLVKLYIKNTGTEGIADTLVDEIEFPSRPRGCNFW